MCQRYVLPQQRAAEREFLPATAWWKFSPKFNVAAPQYVPAIRVHQRQSEGVMLRWGLIPAWLEGAPDSARTWVQSTRVLRSRTYRKPWLNSQRCILPAAGFYTWQLTREKYRQPYFVWLTDRSVFGLAAVWDRWVSEDDDVVESCSILCVPPNPLLTGLTSAQRGMPAILRRKDYAAWLQGTPVEAGAALRPYDAARMQAHRVSPRINSLQVDDPSLIRAAS